MELSTDTVKLQIWDTAGEERFRSITKSYCKGAIAVMVVYDITSLKSFEDVDIWLKEIRQYCEDNTIIALVGNKADL